MVLTTERAHFNLDRDSNPGFCLFTWDCVRLKVLIRGTPEMICRKVLCVFVYKCVPTHERECLRLRGKPTTPRPMDPFSQRRLPRSLRPFPCCCFSRTNGIQRAGEEVEAGGAIPSRSHRFGDNYF